MKTIQPPDLFSLFDGWMITTSKFYIPRVPRKPASMSWQQYEAAIPDKANYYCLRLYPPGVPHSMVDDEVEWTIPTACDKWRVLHITTQVFEEDTAVLLVTADSASAALVAAAMRDWKP